MVFWYLLTSAFDNEALLTQVQVVFITGHVFVSVVVLCSVGKAQHVSRDVVFPLPHKDQRARNAEVLFIIIKNKIVCHSYVC